MKGLLFPAVVAVAVAVVVALLAESAGALEGLPYMYTATNGSLILKTAANSSVVVNGVDIGALNEQSVALTAALSLQTALIDRLLNTNSVQAKLLGEHRNQLCRVALPAIKLPSEGAAQIAHFQIANSDYLCIANERSDTTSHVNSHIYRWSSALGRFDLLQEIPTIGARACEHFQIGSYHYLAIPSHSDGDTPLSVTNTYIFNAFTHQFEHFQALPSAGAQRVTFFAHDEDYFLAIASERNNDSYLVTSPIYTWDKERLQFELWREIETAGASDIEAFSVGGELYLAVAFYGTSSANVEVNSMVYLADESAGEFDPVQSLATAGAVDMHVFEINGRMLLAVANQRTNTSGNTTSDVYEWDTVAGEFKVFQRFPSRYARAWEYYTINGVHYLALALERDGDFTRLQSPIYRWDQTKSQFVQHSHVFTSAPFDLTHFVVEGVDYLATANHQRHGGYFAAESWLYPWNGCSYSTTLPA